MSTVAAPLTASPPVNVPLTSVGLALAVFMQVMDGTIANVSLPTIAGNLGVTPSQSAWVITTFTLCNAIALPLTGFLVRRIGQVRLFLWATLLFTLSSLLCGLAWNMEALLLFRALQGLVAGPMIPTTQALMLSIYPQERRSFALSVIAMVTVVAPIAGPLLGGWITERYAWEWAFLINVPIGLLACSVVFDQLGKRVESTVQSKVDYVGLAALIIGVGALQLVLDKGNDEDWFHSDMIIIASVIAVIGIAFFLIWELTEPNPIVNLKLFRYRNFAAGTLTLILAYSAFFSVNVMVPSWLQHSLNYTAIWAGLAAAPMGILPVLTTPFMGEYAARLNMRMTVCFAFGTLALSCFLRAALGPEAFQSVGTNFHDVSFYFGLSDKGNDVARGEISDPVGVPSPHRGEARIEPVRGGSGAGHRHIGVRAEDAADPSRERAHGVGLVAIAPTSRETGLLLFVEVDVSHLP